MIIFMGKNAEHTPGLAESFSQLHREHGMTAICSSVEVRAWLVDVTNWAARSQTAMELLKFVHMAEKVVYLVGMKGGYQCFSCDEPERGKGVIYIDVQAKLGVRVHGPHTESVVPMHNYISTLHEFGHAKQWIERPEFYTGGVQSTPEFASRILAAARARIKVPAHITAHKDKKAFVDSILKPQDMRQAMPAWSVRTETDNLIRHEWPICREMGYPLRQYTDLVTVT